MTLWGSLRLSRRLVGEGLSKVHWFTYRYCRNHSCAGVPAFTEILLCLAVGSLLA